MSFLENYRAALLATNPGAGSDELELKLEPADPEFAGFIVDHGLGPMWHQRCGREEFRDSRLAAEALYLAQAHALEAIDVALGNAGIDYVVFKGAANRLLLYDNPAIRACHDIDLLVRPEQRVRAATTIAGLGFSTCPEARSIDRELVLERGGVNIDLHWKLLREGRLRSDDTDGMLQRRRRVAGLWMLSPEDGLFALLVHPAFAKHLGAWDMGLHRIADLQASLRARDYDWQTVRGRLADGGVQTAAWATLRWLQILCDSGTVDGVIGDLRPGRLRRSWLNAWLVRDWSERTSAMHALRLLGFTSFLHDRPGDVLRAVVGRRRASRNSADDLAAFGALVDQ